MTDKKLKIAIVEDEESLQRVLVEWLGTEGYEAVGITTGTEALERIPQERPDLILLDLILPEINGLDVMRRLKDNPETAKIPVVIVSNFGEVESRKRAMELGAKNYLVKAEHNLESVKKVIDEVLKNNHEI